MKNIIKFITLTILFNLIGQLSATEIVHCACSDGTTSTTGIVPTEIGQIPPNPCVAACSANGEISNKTCKTNADCANASNIQPTTSCVINIGDETGHCTRKNPSLNVVGMETSLSIPNDDNINDEHIVERNPFDRNGNEK